MTYSKRANGKLLVSSEYYVLDGALGLALPTRLGQRLEVSPSTSPHWTANLAEGEVWFETQLNFLDSPFKSNIPEIQLLSDILKYIQNLNVPKWSDLINHKFETYLEFDKSWGLGSSSTFLALIADYFGVDAYELNEHFFSGSGYDIACANADSPIVYQIVAEGHRMIEPATIDENVSDRMYFVYTGLKQSSRAAIEHYQSKSQESRMSVAQSLSDITVELIGSKDYREWEYLLRIHEDIVSKELKLPKVSEGIMNNFPWMVKSLGAWGGDFVMCIADAPIEDVKKVCKERNFETIFNFKSLIL